jgi:hypothetical protein
VWTASKQQSFGPQSIYTSGVYEAATRVVAFSPEKAAPHGSSKSILEVKMLHELAEAL